jgi:hypothetical protein
VVRIRVHQLARELGVESATILAKLRAMGEFVHSASTPLDADLERRLRAQFRSGFSATPNSVSTTDDALRAAAEIFGGEAVGQMHSNRTDRRPAAARRSADTRAAQLRSHQADWASRWFDPAERDAWIKAGLRNDQAAVADACRREGLTPSDLDTRVQGITVAHRLRGGEAVGSVVARLRELDTAGPAKRRRDIGGKHP